MNSSKLDGAEAESGAASSETVTELMPCAGVAQTETLQGGLIARRYVFRARCECGFFLFKHLVPASGVYQLKCGGCKQCVYVSVRGRVQMLAIRALTDLPEDMPQAVREEIALFGEHLL